MSVSRPSAALGVAVLLAGCGAPQVMEVDPTASPASATAEGADTVPPPPLPAPALPAAEAATSTARVGSGYVGVPASARIEGTTSRPCLPGDAAACTGACDNDEPRSCTTLARMYARGSGVARDAAYAATLLEKACTGGDLGGCARLAEAYAEGDGVGTDESRASELAAKACDGNDLLGCGVQGGLSLESDEATGVRLLRRACSGGVPSACVRLGTYYVYGSGSSAVDPKGSLHRRPHKAVALFRRACDVGDGEGCVRLGLLYLEGTVVPEDEVQAARLFGKACDAGEGQGCYELADAYEQGDGVPRDVKRAAELTRKACDLGFLGACSDDDI
jgi:TPR repeat protein